MNAGPGGTGGYLWGDRQEQLATALQQTATGTGVAVGRSPEHQVKLVVPEAAGFATGAATIQPPLAQVLDALGKELVQSSTAVVDIAGHTDNSGTDSVDTPLSQQRAQAVADYLIAQSVPTARIAAQGYGSQHPIADDSTPAGRTANRRTIILIGEPESADAEAVPAPAAAASEPASASPEPAPPSPTPAPAAPA